MARRAVAKSAGQSDRSPNGRSTIGLLVSDVSEAQAAEVWSAVRTAARTRDANLVCFNVGGIHRPDRIEQDPRTPLGDLVSDESVDGLVTFMWWRGREWFEHIYERFRPVPVVNVMRLYEGYHGVAWDNQQVVHDLVSHLVDVHGYRRIAYIGAIEGNLVAEERHRAYIEALERHGIEVDPDLIKPGDYGNDGDPAPAPALFPLGLGLGILQIMEAAHGLFQILSEGGIFFPIQLDGLLEQSGAVLHLSALSGKCEPDGPSSHHLLAIAPQPVAQARCLFRYPETLGLDGLAIG